MNQNQQFKKVKMYRALKICFYCLGLPLFVLAVFMTSIKFIGHDPFTGTTTATDSLGFFQGYEQLFTSPALFGVWAALALWLVITIVHIILRKTVKSSKARVLGVTAFCVVIMLVGVLVCDSMFEASINEMIAYEEAAGNGVVVKDFETQLSYYRVLSSNAQKKNDTTALINKVHLLENVYNVEMIGKDKSGTAGNMSNKPVSYYTVIADDGTVGVDISFKRDEKGLLSLNVDDKNNIVPDGDITKEVEGNQLIRLAPINGKLVINGVTYSHYFPVKRVLKDKTEIYVWYTIDMMPVGTIFGEKNETVETDGIYGKAIYNQTGLISDGWVFSLDNVLNILEDYYEGQSIIKELDPDGTMGESIHELGVELRDLYYNGVELDGGYKLDDENVAWMRALYNQESDLASRFSLTRGEIDLLISKLAGFLGDNSLFDFLLKPVEDGSGSGLENVLGQAGLGSIAAIIDPALEQLAQGMSLAGIVNDDATMTTIIDIVKSVVGYSGAMSDMYIMLTYGGRQDAMGITHEGMYLAIVKDNGAGAIGTDPRKVQDGGDILIDIDFRDALLDEENSDYAFDLDHLSEFLNDAIDGLLSHFGVDLKSILVDNTIGKLLGGLLIKDITVDGKVYKGLVISGISIPLFDENYNAKIDIIGIVENLLEGLYKYQSAVFKPAWEFYELIQSDDATFRKVARAYAQYERANYIGSYYGALIGSTLIGDSLGTGAYPSSLGLQSLQEVKQLQRDLSYKPIFYPLYAFRDMMLYFGALTIFFYFMSFVMHEKEKECARGEMIIKDKKSRKGKKNKVEDTESDDIIKDDVDADSKEQPALPVDQNTDKEVR